MIGGTGGSIIGTTATTPGGTGGGRGATGGTGGVQIPSTSNPYKLYFANPMYSGWGPSITSTRTARTAGGFGTPLVTVTTTPTTQRALTTQQQQSVSFNTVGVRKNTPYITVWDPTIPIVPYFTPGPTDVQRVIERTTMVGMIGPRAGINVTMEGDTVVLRGNVATPKDARIAEGVVRMEPGVRNVRNELRIVGSTN
jgi:hypothetical protein